MRECVRVYDFLFGIKSCDSLNLLLIFIRFRREGKQKQTIIQIIFLFASKVKMDYGSLSENVLKKL